MSPPAISLIRARSTTARGEPDLRRRLIAVDAVAASVAWLVAVGPERWQGLRNGLVVLALVNVTLLLVASQRLYLTRVCTLRSVENGRLVRVAVLAGLAGVGLARLQPGAIAASSAVIGAGATLVLLSWGRGSYRGYLRWARRSGRFCRQVVLVGDNDESRGLERLLAEHPDLGFEIVGVAGAREGVRRRQFTAPYVGQVADVPEIVRSTGATGVIVATTAVDPAALNCLTRDLVAAGVHVHLSSGLNGIGHERLRPQPMAYEPMYYIEPFRPSTWELAAKRGADILLGSVGIILALPIMALAALAIKVDTRGPVLFRQTRVGRDGRQFRMLKLRTMVPDAESLYDDLAATRAGRGGPLVKLRDDPRITRVGRALRVMSIDELPQLFNVVAGSMSLVGPRPNLLAELPGLDPSFVARKSMVRPGITGLWQVEARDNPSFDVYRRLDLFYIENWSNSLDVAILLSTVRQVAGRVLRFMLPSRVCQRVGISRTGLLD